MRHLNIDINKFDGESLFAYKEKIGQVCVTNEKLPCDERARALSLSFCMCTRNCIALGSWNRLLYTFVWNRLHQVISIKIRNVLYQLSMVYSDSTSICYILWYAIANCECLNALEIAFCEASKRRGTKCNHWNINRCVPHETKAEEHEDEEECETRDASNNSIFVLHIAQ